MSALLDPADVVSDDGADVEAPRSDSRTTIMPPGAVAAQVAGIVGQDERRDLILVTDTEQRAERLSAILTAFLPDRAVHMLPASDALPGSDDAASPAIVARWRAVLEDVEQPDRPPILIVCAIEAAVRKVAPGAAASLVLKPGDAIATDAMTSRLQELGYRTEDRVEEVGDCAVRGMIDIFPGAAERPVRIEHRDGTVVALHGFDPLTQRSGEELVEVRIDAVVEPRPGADAITLFDVLPDARIVIEAEVERQRDRYRRLCDDVARAGGRTMPMMTADEWSKLVATRTPTAIETGATPIPRFVERTQPARALARAIRSALGKGHRVVLTGIERDRRFLARRVAGLVDQEVHAVRSWHEVSGDRDKLLISLAAPVDQGWSEKDVLVIAAADVIGSRAEHDAGVAGVDPLILQPTSFGIGDVVLHEDHGLGILRGLEPVVVGEARQDALRIEYAKAADRLVPVTELDRLWRYGAGDADVALDSLSGESWQKRRIEIDAAIAETAKGLVQLAEARAAAEAIAIVPPVAAYESFAAGFPFSETRDQGKAIAAVRDDLASGRPMDRLIVGDVGYGKTEVALRAAAAVALAGRQVVLIAPTTVLVRQHLETFRARFAGSGLRVEGLSRLSGTADAKAVRAGLADGTIDIVIGTSAVTAHDVRFERLALVIVDEEQRFGAADKQALRTLCETCHLLTLTATPIPRTLQMAIVGLQDISVLATPPARRQPVLTVTGAFDSDTIRAALLREKMRYGQSFVVAPRIADLDALAGRLAELVPELEVVKAHGRMKAADIDEVMLGFAQGRGDVLLATNIVEAGLDVPRANTMVIWRADRFGLAQLHQLRGRVGRGARRGRIFLTTEPGVEMSPATLRRLATLAAHDRLGAGFEVSARDLDARGAGDLLGDQQAGHVKLIGVDLYQHLLGGAIAAARGEPVALWTPELVLGIDSLLPDDWIAEPEVRLEIYARLAKAGSAAEIEALAEEMEDRFGQVPAAARQLFLVGRIRQLARTARIARIDAGPAAIALTLRSDFGGDAASAGLEEKGGRWLRRGDFADADERVAAVLTLVEELAEE